MKRKSRQDNKSDLLFLFVAMVYVIAGASGGDHADCLNVYIQAYGGSVKVSEVSIILYYP